MSMGWNPTFDDVKAKTVEPWILHDFDEDRRRNEEKTMWFAMFLVVGFW